MDNRFDSPQYVPTLERVKGVIGEKAWYGYDEQTGAFDLSKSIRKIIDSLEGFTGLEDQVREAFESSYTPDYLTTVQSEADGQAIRLPLVAAIGQLGLEQFIWTVGDTDYQRLKFTRSTTSDYIDNEHYYCMPADKFSELRKILGGLKTRERIQDMQVIIVDDKDVQTHRVKEMAPEYNENQEGRKAFNVSEYYINLKDPNANAQAFYEFVLKFRQENSQTELVLILDFDGVVADTNSVITGPVAEKLTMLLLTL